MIERGLRACLIILAILFLARKWGVDLTAMAAQDTFAMQVIRGIFSAAVMVLGADFIWHISRTVIDRKIADESNPGEPGSEEARRKARMRTCCRSLRMYS
jgi:hypothetical protein